jgi:hypothetical protein
VIFPVNLRGTHRHGPAANRHAPQPSGVCQETVDLIWGELKAPSADSAASPSQPHLDSAALAGSDRSGDTSWESGLPATGWAGTRVRA